jgi:hypothetical protein
MDAVMEATSCDSWTGTSKALRSKSKALHFSTNFKILKPNKLSWNFCCGPSKLNFNPPKLEVEPRDLKFCICDLFRTRSFPLLTG